MKYLALLFLLFCCFLRTLGQTNTILRIDPDNASGGTAAEIFDSIRFIPLETVEESRINLIDQLEVTDSFFIILDQLSTTIFLFSRDGKFKTKIKGNNRKRYFGYFSVLRDSNQMVVLNVSKNILEVYDFGGKLIKEMKAPPNAQSVFVLNDSTFLFSLKRSNRNNTKPSHAFDLCITSRNGDVIKYLRPFNTDIQDAKYNIMTSPLNYSGEPGSCMFSLPFDYLVRQINDTGIFRTYQFVFPYKYSLPPNFESDASFSGRRADYAYNDPANRDKYNTLFSVFKVGDNVLFSAWNSRMLLVDDVNFLYNVKNERLISFRKVTGDSSSFYFAPLNTAFEHVNAVSGNKIFTLMSSLQILSAIKSHPTNTPYPPALSKLIETGTKLNNPVIVMFELKERP